MASGPITLWQIEGEKVGAVKDFIFLDSKITGNDDYSHEIKRHLLLGRKAMTIASILKSRDITLLTEVHIVKAMVFPAVTYRCESWTIKKTKCQRTDAFELWCWRRLLRFPWTARRSNQSILKEINPEYSLEGLLLKLKLQYLGCMTWRDDSTEKTPEAGKDWKQWEKGVTEDEVVGQHHRLRRHESEHTPGDSGGQSLVCCSPWSPKDQTQLSNWKTTTLLRK